MKKHSPFTNVIPLRPRSEEQRANQSIALEKVLTSDGIGSVLGIILDKAVLYSGAEGGSIYFIENLRQDSYGGALPRFKRALRFYKSINKKIKNNTRSQSEFIEIDNSSIAGYVASTGTIVRIQDCYKLPPDTPFKFQASFDTQTNYKTKSVLAAPIISNKGEVLGVVQVVNKIKKSKDKRARNKSTIVQFTKQDEQLIEALASQAAIAIENAKLSQDIASLFESFVQASVSAIEARDPSTSGHSDRVATLTVGLAQIVDQSRIGTFKDVRFSKQQIQEIRYASLLHDFGKIGVRENVLLKAKKLYPHELETILLRLETLKAKNEARIWRLAIEDFNSQITQLKSDLNSSHAQPHSHESKQLLLSTIPQTVNKHYIYSQSKVDEFNQKLEAIRKNIMSANESQVMDGDFDIQGLIDWIQNAAKNVGQLVLTEDEIKRLSIPRGTLSVSERKEIESHVSFTFQFLSQIAWTEDLARVPEIAHAHHEKLDGSGYPQRLTSDHIPLQSRMMAISDIYDALTAMDRPYKKAVGVDRALEILHIEANQGKLDKELLRVFIEAEVYKSVIEDKKRRAG